MYNRYIPGSNGIYERKTIAEPNYDPPNLPCPSHTPEPSAAPEILPPQHPSVGPQTLDLGDLLLLCIAMLLLLDGEEEDLISILIMAAAFLFLS